MSNCQGLVETHDMPIAQFFLGNQRACWQRCTKARSMHGFICKQPFRFSHQTTGLGLGSCLVRSIAQRQAHGDNQHAPASKQR